MTSVVPRWTAPADSYMTKTPFVRTHSSSFEDDDEDDDEDLEADLDLISSIKDQDHLQQQHQSAAPPPVKIEINKKHVANASSVPVVNKMSQHIYADNHNQSNHPLKGLKRYKILSLIGDGTYGLVYMATNVETREKVAIKAMKRKYHSWDEVMDLREVKSLKKLHHPNVVKLKEVIRENSRLYFVFEYVKGDLLGLMREKAEPFPEFWIRSVIQQVLQGLAYMHRLGFFHRDLKPENILATGPDVVKIADFGLVREIRSSPPYTDYVSTRWYRAPEVLLRSTNYNSPIDIWAVGCITSELYTKRPLFPGTSEIDQLYKISSILGTPGRNDWSEGFSLANQMSFRFPTFSSTHLSNVLGTRSSARAVSFLYALLSWNPSWRSSAQEALRHSYFRINTQHTPNHHHQHHQHPHLPNNVFHEDSEAGEMAELCAQSVLSLSLRPRNNNHNNNNEQLAQQPPSQQQPQSQAQQQNQPHGGMRLPLPLTEIEPHYSRDLARPIKEEQQQRPKTPPSQQQPPQPQEELKDEDLNDLISAFSLDASGFGKKNNHKARGKVVILSPQRRMELRREIEVATAAAAASPTLRIPRRNQRNRSFQVQNAYNGLNFSPTTTKFTLLYGHHQPPTFKIVSPAKLGIVHPAGTGNNISNFSRQNAEEKIEELMGKKILPVASAAANSSGVFRSLPDFTKKQSSINNGNGTQNNSSAMMTPLPRKPNSSSVLMTTERNDLKLTSMNVNGKGLAGSEQTEKPKIHVRPDWAAKYLK